MFLENNLWKKVKNKKVKRHYEEMNYNQINKQEYELIDVRTRAEFLEYHLEKSKNIPLHEIKEQIENIVPDKEKKLLVYCQTGNRSKKAIRILEKLGYTQLYNLKGGLENM